jgi:hypothetical protein
VLNRLSRLPNSFSESFLFVEGLPLTAVEELNEMLQCTPCREQISFGVLVLDICRQQFGHGAKCCN